MSLRPARELIAKARAKGYAVGYFESWNLESLQGVIDAAETSRSPIFIGFNGEFLSRPGRCTAERLSWYAALGRAAAESAQVPCSLVFNECSNDRWVQQAVDLRFGLVMLDDPAAEPGHFACRVAKLTQYAHQRGVAVEGEVGHLPCGTAERSGVGSATDPEEAACFASATGVDLLAVSVGNVHILLQGSRKLDLDHLAAIRQRVEVPFALHGGTGIARDSLREAIPLGVVKVSYGTYLKQRYLEAIRAALKNEEVDPHRLLGLGGSEDLLVAGRLAVKEAVLERLEFLGCCGRA